MTLQSMPFVLLWLLPLLLLAATADAAAMHG